MQALLVVEGDVAAQGLSKLLVVVEGLAVQLLGLDRRTIPCARCRSSCQPGHALQHAKPGQLLAKLEGCVLHDGSGSSPRCGESNGPSPPPGTTTGPRPSGRSRPPPSPGWAHFLLCTYPSEQLIKAHQVVIAPLQVPREEASRLLGESGGHVKTAIVMSRLSFQGIGGGIAPLRSTISP